MAQDIRKMLKEALKLENKKMPKGHEQKFIDLLDKELPGHKKRSSYSFLYVAASFLILIGIGLLVNNNFKEQPSEKVTVVDLPKEKNKNYQLTLGDISPELKQIEDYYVTHINLELLELDPNDDNKKIIDKYLIRLGELNDEYENLTDELNDIGPNEQTINALINNLQLRLQLLERLKEKLKEFKDIENETYSNPQV